MEQDRQCTSSAETALSNPGHRYYVSSSALRRHSIQCCHACKVNTSFPCKLYTVHLNTLIELASCNSRVIGTLRLYAVSVLGIVTLYWLENIKHVTTSLSHVQGNMADAG